MAHRTRTARLALALLLTSIINASSQTSSQVVGSCQVDPAVEGSTAALAQPLLAYDAFTSLLFPICAKSTYAQLPSCPVGKPAALAGAPSLGVPQEEKSGVANVVRTSPDNYMAEYKVLSFSADFQPLARYSIDSLAPYIGR